MPFRIRTKLVIAFLAIIIPYMVIAGIISIYNLNIIFKGVNKVETVTGEMHKSHSLQLALDMALMPANDYIITGEKRHKEEFQKASVEVERWLKELEGELSGLEGLFPAEVKEEREILKDVRASWEKVREMSLRIFEIQNPVGNSDAAVLMEEMDYKWAYPAIERLRRWQEIDKEEYREAHEESERALRKVVIVMIAGGVILLFFGGSFAVFYSRIFVRPIEAIHKSADAIARGEFRTRLDIKTGDELQQLSDAMNEMAEQLDSFYGSLEDQVKERTREFQFERDKLKSVFEAMEDGVYLVDQDYNIQYLNPVLLKEFGPIEGKKCYSYFHDRTEVCPWCPNQRVFAGETVRWEWTSFKNDKTYDLMDTPLRNPDGSVSKLEIFRDITERKKAEEDLRLHGEIERNMAEAVYLIRVSDGVIVYTNPFFERMFGYEPGELVGKHVSIVNAPGDKSSEAVANEIISILMRTGMWNGEVHNIRKDGTTFWCHANVFTFEHPQHGRVWLSMHQDITERKKAEEALKQRLDELMRFEKATIQREFRMKELKDEIKKLKDRIAELEGRPRDEG